MLPGLVCQRRILQQQLPHALDVAGMTRRRQIDERAARLEVGHDLRGSHRPVARHIPPAAVEVVAIGQVNWPRAVHPQCIDVRAAPQQFVDRVELPRHRGPVDWLAGSLVALGDELRLGIEQLAHPLKIVFRSANATGSPFGEALNLVSSVSVSSCSICV